MADSNDEGRHRARASAPAVESRPWGGGRRGVQWLMKDRPGPEKDAHAARFAEVFDVPCVSMGMLARQELVPLSALYNKICRKEMNLAMRLCRRGYSSSQTSFVPQSPVPPPADWEYPFFHESPLRIARPPGHFEPSFAKILKTMPGIVTEVCLDEAEFVINYEPWAYMEAFPLFRKKIIYGSKPNKHGVKQTMLLPSDGGLYLMRSLPYLAHFFHQQQCCLPRISMSDLVITGAGKFRLRGSDIAFREFTLENVRDVYNNIRELFIEMLAPYGGPSQVPGDFSGLNYQLKNFGVGDTAEYLIYYHVFFLPLGNKAHALLRIIDLVLELPRGSGILNTALADISSKGSWKVLAEGNYYLKQWMDHREYGDGNLEFIRFVRAVICHKLKYGLPDKFVDFLVYATFPTLLGILQRNLWTIDMLKQLQLGELFPHTMPSRFVVINDLPDSTLPPVVFEEETADRSSKHSTSSSSSSGSKSSSRDSDSSSSSGGDLDVKAPQQNNGVKENVIPVDQENDSLNTLNLPEESTDPIPVSADVEGENVKQVSPGKKIRAALLRSRFADTILKAREKSLDQVTKKDPEKFQCEREELEKLQREERARLQAETKAAEDALKRAEAAAAAEAAAEAKRQRELEREAARKALQEMEKTVDINDGSLFLKDLEMLGSVTGEQIPCSVGETSPNHA